MQIENVRSKASPSGFPFRMPPRLSLTCTKASTLASSCSGFAVERLAHLRIQIFRKHRGSPAELRPRHPLGLPAQEQGRHRVGEEAPENHQAGRPHQLPLRESPASEDASSPTQGCRGVCQPTVAPGGGQLRGDGPAAFQRSHRPARWVDGRLSPTGQWTFLCYLIGHLSLLHPGLSGAMASISVRSGAPSSPTHPAQPLSRRRNGLHDVDLNTFIAEEMARHLDTTANRKRGPAPCSDVITDSPTHKRNRMLWTVPTALTPPPRPPTPPRPPVPVLVTDWTADGNGCLGQNPWMLPPFDLSCNARNKGTRLSQTQYILPFDFSSFSLLSTRTSSLQPHPF